MQSGFTALSTEHVQLIGTFFEKIHDEADGILNIDDDGHGGGPVETHPP